jgi:hypothetical protein
MSDFFLWLGGADFASLNRCRSERPRLVALGGAVLMTSVLATCAGALALHDWLHAPLVFALFGGAFWGVSIMNLDRWVMLTVRRQSTPSRTITLAIPRLLLAVVVGIVISGPLVLEVFHSEITARALQDRQATLAQARKKLSSEYSRIEELGREQRELQSASASSPVSNVLAGSKDFTTLQSQLAEQQKQLQAAQQQAICELDGTCGTRHSGAGPVYHVKEQQAQAIAAQVTVTENRLRDLESTLVSEAKTHAKQGQGFANARLGTVESELATLRKQYGASDAGLVRSYDAPIGLLDRVQALGELSSEHPAMKYTWLLLMTFVLLLDSIPVCFKLLTLLGAPSLYELIQKDAEERRLHRHELAEDQRDVAARIEATEIVEEARFYAKLNRAALEERTRQIVDVEKSVTRSLISELRARAMRDIPDLVESYASRRDRLAKVIRIDDARRATSGPERDWAQNGSGPES